MKRTTNTDKVAGNSVNQSSRYRRVNASFSQDLCSHQVLLPMRLTQAVRPTRSAEEARHHALCKNAHARTATAINRGNIRDPRDEPCADCGRTSTDKDHRDYEKWWEIAAVCHSCNVKRGRTNAFAHLLHPNEGVRRAEANHIQFVGQFAASMLEIATDGPECAALLQRNAGAIGFSQAKQERNTP